MWNSSLDGESQIDYANFESFLITSPSNAYSGSSFSNSIGSSSLMDTNSDAVLMNPFQTRESSDDLTDFSGIDANCPSDLYSSLPVPKDFKPQMSFGLGGRGFEGLSKFEPECQGFYNEHAAEEILTMAPNNGFVSPRVMSFSQGFGLEPFNQVTNEYNLSLTSTQFPFSQAFISGEDMTAPSPHFGMHSKPDTPNMDLNAMFKAFGHPHHHHEAAGILPQGHPRHHHHESEESFEAHSSNLEEDVLASIPTRLDNRSNSPVQLTNADIHISSSDETPKIAEIASSCHHCKRRRHPRELKPCHRNSSKKGAEGNNNNSSRRTCRKRYCLGCLQKYNITFADADKSDWTCMACRGACECAACRRKGA